MDQPKYCAFISYRHQSPDQEIAKSLHTAIETYGIPASVKKKTGIRRMGKVFRDQEELPLSNDLGADIEAALDRSDWFIAICSPRYPESRWCLRELEYFIEHKGRGRVLTVLAEGEPDDSFPDIIRYSTDEQGATKESEPLAADVRAETLPGSLKKLRAEKLRIIAPMLGLSYDDLKRRARQRRIRIISIVSAAAFAAASASTAFLVINHERQEALKREAEQNARIAEEQTKLAEEKDRIAQEQTKLAEDNAKLAEEQKQIAEDNAKLAEEQTKLAEDNAKLAEEQTRIAEEQTRIAEEKDRVAQEQTKLAEDNAKLAEEQTRIAEEQTRIAEEKDRVAQEQTKLAEDNAKLAEEQTKLAEEQHRIAVSSEIGELLAQANDYLEDDDRIYGAKTLLEALRLSDGADQVKRQEILDMLRRDLYFMPFTSISGFENENVRMGGLVLSPDGTRAIGRENRNSVTMLDFAAGRPSFKVSSGEGSVGGLVFSPDGSRFLGNYGSHVTVWDSEDGKEIFTYRGKEQTGKDIANAFFWKDAGTLLIQDWDKLYFVSVTDGTERHFYTIGEHQEWYSAGDNLYTQLTGQTIGEIMWEKLNDYEGTPMAVAEDWSSIMIGGRDGTTGTLLINENGELVCPLTICPGTVFERVGISPDGETAVWISQLGYLTVWDVKTRKLMYVKNFIGEDFDDSYPISGIAFSPDSRFFAFTAQNRLIVLEVRTADAYMDVRLEQSAYLPSIIFSSDGEYMLVNDHNLYVFNGRTIDPLVFRQEDDPLAGYNSVLPLDHTFFTTKLSGAVSILARQDIASIKRETELPSPLRARPDTVTAPEGAPALTGEHNVVAGMWENVEDVPEEYLATRTVYSRDGSLAAMMYRDGVIELFDTFGDGKPKRTLGQLTMPISSVAMTETRLAASDVTGDVLFYDLEREKVIRIVSNRASYREMIFNESGDLMIGWWARNDGKVLDVFRASTGELLFSISHGVGFTDCGFTEDGNYAVGVTEYPGSDPELTNRPSYMVANLYMNDDELIEQARRLTSVFTR